MICKNAIGMPSVRLPPHSAGIAVARNKKLVNDQPGHQSNREKQRHDKSQKLINLFHCRIHNHHETPIPHRKFPLPVAFRALQASVPSNHRPESSAIARRYWTPLGSSLEPSSPEVAIRTLAASSFQAVTLMPASRKSRPFKDCSRSFSFLHALDSLRSLRKPCTALYSSIGTPEGIHDSTALAIAHTSASNMPPGRTLWRPLRTRTCPRLAACGIQFA
jgi:hypothetical protein